MILDERNEFADAVSVAAAAGTALIGDVIDLGLIARDMGVPEHLFLVISVDTEIITGGSAGTIKFQLASDAQAAIATDGSATIHWDSGTFVTDDSAANDTLMNAGSILAQIALPMSGRVYERYLGILCVIGTTTVTAGAISAYLTPDKHTNAAKHYAEGVNKMALVNFKRDFFSADGVYYQAGTREYNGPLQDGAGNSLLPSDAVVAEGTLPFQANSPVPKPGFGAQPLEQQVLALVPGAAPDGQIHAADPGSAPVELTEEEKKAKEAASAETKAAEVKADDKADDELAASITEGAANAAAVAEEVKDIIDPLADLNLGGDKPKGKGK